MATKTLEFRLTKAKAALVMDHPFIGAIALTMPFIPNDTIPTAATNGKRVLFNPGFINSLTDAEVLFLVAHECLHPMLDHNYRRGQRGPRRWNKAADYIINQLLIDEGIGKKPEIGVYNPTIYAMGGGTSEGVYDILPEENETDGTKGLLDDCEDGDNSPVERADWKVRVAQAAQAARMMGKLSRNMQRLVTEVLQPKVDWRAVLQRFLVKCSDDRRSFARFNRRFVSQGLYLPSLGGETLGEVVFAVDCSGSISQRTIDQFAAEINKVKEDLRPKRIHILYFDTAVSHVESYGPHDRLDIKPRGGGGTDFAPVFASIVEHEFDPVAIVFLTDLHCSSFGTQPDAPVLWVTTERGEAPFGEVVEIGGINFDQ